MKSHPGKEKSKVVSRVQIPLSFHLRTSAGTNLQGSCMVFVVAFTTKRNELTIIDLESQLSGILKGCFEKGRTFVEILAVWARFEGDIF